MNMISIELDKNIDKEEFFKSLSFVSPDIKDVILKDESIEIYLSEDVDRDYIFSLIEKNKKKYKKLDLNNDVYFTGKTKISSYLDMEKDNENIIFFENGQIGFGEKGKFLLEFFDDIFRNIAIKMNAIEKIYPVLLPVKEYAQTGYIKKSPQYAIFCSSIKDKMDDLEDANSSIEKKQAINIIKEPEYALSPSACFHTYIEYQNKNLPDNTLITFKQNVFRNEGRFNYREVGRLRDYQVREIVMIGDVNYVERIRKEIMDETCNIINGLGLDGDISLASDSFIVPKMQMYKKIQRIDKSKYEVHLSVSNTKKISAASFNLHGKAFTDNFNISVDNCEDTVTGCVGFGLQRWVIAFVSQYGWEIDNWPEIVKNRCLL